MDANKEPTTTLWLQIHVPREMVDLLKELVLKIMDTASK